MGLATAVDGGCEDGVLEMEVEVLVGDATAVDSVRSVRCAALESCHVIKRLRPH